MVDLSRRRFLQASAAIAAAAAVPAIASSPAAELVDQVLELEASPAIEISPIAGRVISAIVLDGGRQVIELADRLMAGGGLWVKPGQVLELVRRRGRVRLELDGLAVVDLADETAGALAAYGIAEPWAPFRVYVDELELAGDRRRWLRQAGELVDERQALRL